VGAAGKHDVKGDGAGSAPNHDTESAKKHDSGKGRSGK
jgi:hypothetical protein